MNIRQTILTAILSSIFTLTIMVTLMMVFSQAMAASATIPPKNTLSQTTNNLQFVSISGLAFNPIGQSIAYEKNIQQQLLSLTGQTRNFINTNRFIAPVMLPDRSELVGMTVFGEDIDNLGEVRLRLKRCHHGQAFCVILAETTSSANYAAGSFETPRSSILNEVVDNRFYTYFLELELTALGKSGLRSVRLEIVTYETTITAGTKTQWALSENTRSFELPNTALTQVEICANDLSHLPNSTHYPFLVVDGQTTTLSSSKCVTVWGRKIEIRRELNTGPSKGTYQFLR